MARYFLEVMYDGTAYHGSQVQGDTPTVQLEVNKALSTILRKDVETFGASRTDEGVHALCSMYHFDWEDKLYDNLLYKLNAIFSPNLSAKGIYLTKGPELNARFDAMSRQYRYRLYPKKDPFRYHKVLYYPYRLDTSILNQTAEIIKEYTDFESFSKRNTQTYTYLCTILQSKWEQVNDELHYVVEANRFLRGMVRALVSTQLQVARGRYTIEDFRKIIEAKDCTKADFSVPGHGLYLEQIKYPEGSLIPFADTAT